MMYLQSHIASLFIAHFIKIPADTNFVSKRYGRLCADHMAKCKADRTVEMQAEDLCSRSEQVKADSNEMLQQFQPPLPSCTHITYIFNAGIKRQCTLQAMEARFSAHILSY